MSLIINISHIYIDLILTWFFAVLVVREVDKQHSSTGKHSNEDQGVHRRSPPP